MSINLTDEIEVKTKKGKLCAAKQIFLEGDTQTVENEIQDINSRHNTLNTKHESLSRTVQGIAATGGASTANNVTYNNNASGLNAENTQDAIDEVSSIGHFAKRGGIVNISTNYNSTNTAEVLTLSQALSKVPSTDRVLGFQGKYLASDSWHTIIYTGDSLTSWSDKTKWIDLADKVFNSISKNSTFAGIAVPTTNPGTPDGNVFYFAVETGTYSNFGGISVADGEVVILEWKGSWEKKVTGFVTQQQFSELEVLNVNNTALGYSVKDGYISGSTILSVSYASYTSPIFVKKGDTIKINCWAISSVNVLSKTDELGTKYERLVVGTSKVEQPELQVYQYTAPLDMYIACSYLKYNNLKNPIILIDNTRITKDEGDILDNNRILEDTYFSDNVELNLLDLVDKSVKYAINSNGSISTWAYTRRTNGISVRKGDVIKVNCWAAPSISVIAKKNNDDTYTPLIIGQGNTSDDIRIDYNYTAIEDMEVVISYFNTTINPNTEKCTVSIISTSLQQQITDNYKIFNETIFGQEDIITTIDLYNQGVLNILLPSKNPVNYALATNPIKLDFGETISFSAWAGGTCNAICITDENASFYNVLVSGKSSIEKKEILYYEYTNSTEKNGIYVALGWLKGGIENPIINITKRYEPIYKSLEEKKESIYVNGWGDSLTQGTTNPNYMQWLQELLGRDYTVNNGGRGGASISEIIANQAGTPIYTTEEFTIPNTTEEFTITTKVKNIFKETFNLSFSDNVVSLINPIVINGIYLKIVDYTKDTITLSRLNEGYDSITIPVGTNIYFNSFIKNRDAINVFMIGVNNAAWKKEATMNDNMIEYFVKYHKKAIESLGTNKYIVLGVSVIAHKLYLRGEDTTPTVEEYIQQFEAYEKRMEEEFGNHWINIRKFMTSDASLKLAVELGYLSEETYNANKSVDAEWISKGCNPYSFMSYQNGDYLHPNSIGYKMIAYLVAQKIKTL